MRGTMHYALKVLPALFMEDAAGCISSAKRRGSPRLFLMHWCLKKNSVQARPRRGGPSMRRRHIFLGLVLLLAPSLSAKQVGPSTTVAASPGEERDWENQLIHELRSSS